MPPDKPVTPAGLQAIRSQRRRRVFSYKGTTELAEAERLLRDTELTAAACARAAGIDPASPYFLKAKRKHRAYIDTLRWLDADGNLHPNECNLACAAAKVGLSGKTIRRRVAEGLVEAQQSATGLNMLTFDSEAVVKLSRIGRKKPGGRRDLLTPDDVRAIRQAKANGRSTRALSDTYGISVRQVDRICNRTRWKDVT